MMESLKRTAEKALRIGPVEKDAKPDRHKDATVVSVNSDGSYNVVFDGEPDVPARCRAFCLANVGDRVSVCVRNDGMHDVIGRLGGEIGGGSDEVPITHSWNGTTLSITSASGTSSADLKGEQGPAGASGVHVGSDAPPETANVWVDYSGEPSGSEKWTFTLEDGTEISKTIVVLN